MNKTFINGFLSGTSVVALGLVALLLGSGFQGANQKIGVIDSGQVASAIAQAKNLRDDEEKFKTDRQNVLEFLDRYRVMKRADAETFKKLSLKPNITDAEKAELEKVKSAAVEAQKKFKDLELKSSPTADELKQLDEFRNRTAEMVEIGGAAVKEYEEDIRALKEKNQTAVFEAYKNGVSEVGKKQGFTLVLDKNVAPFGANDISDDVVKVAAKK
jgi:Skp family chaperone for outer membrane proteins